MKWATGSIAAVFALVFSLVIGASGASGAAACGGAASVNVAGIAADAHVGTWNAEQLTNAAHIMNAASAMGLGVRAEQVGVMTAMGESSLRNISYGDNAINPDGSVADSIGLFQQQSSWGSTVDRMDPATSARLFFERLVKVPGWEQMDPSRAAHAVQINSDPNHYTRWWDDAVTVTDYLARTHPGTGPVACSSGKVALPLDPPYTLTSDYGRRHLEVTGDATFHPAVDLAGKCGDPIYAVLPGTVTRSDDLFLSVTSPDGYVISYLHSYKNQRSVNMGDKVTAGQSIALVGSAPPSTGCHLDIRIYIIGSTDPRVAALPTSPERPGYANPHDFFTLFGVDICDPKWCTVAPDA